MKQSLSIFILVLYTTSIYGQDFCNKYFGNSWAVYPPYNRKDKNILENDSITFIRSSISDTDYIFLDINCLDSTFTIVSVYMVTIINNQNQEQNQLVKGWTGDKEGKWSYNKINNIITFKLNESNKEYRFKIFSTEDKKNIWRSDEDYRTKIILLRQ